MSEGQEDRISKGVTKKSTEYVQKMSDGDSGLEVVVMWKLKKIKGNKQIGNF